MKGESGGLWAGEKGGEERREGRAEGRGGKGGDEVRRKEMGDRRRREE